MSGKQSKREEPSASNSQPWEFIIINDQKIIDAIAEQKGKMEGLRGGKRRVAIEMGLYVNSSVVAICIRKGGLSTAAWTAAAASISLRWKSCWASPTPTNWLLFFAWAYLRGYRRKSEWTVLSGAGYTSTGLAIQAKGLRCVPSYLYIQWLIVYWNGEIP
jgi:nitroreductase